MVIKIILHLFIQTYAVPRKKLGDFTYYLDNLDMPFTFIDICETWATQLNEYILNLPGYKHELYIRSNKRVSLYRN